MPYIIRNVNSDEFDAFLAKGGYTSSSLRDALTWKTSSGASRAMENEARNNRRFDRNQYEVVEISEEEYQKGIQGRFAVGDTVIQAKFDDLYATVQPLEIKTTTIVRQSPHHVYTEDGTEFCKKDHYSDEGSGFQRLFASQEELQQAIDDRYPKNVLRRVNLVSRTDKEFWQSVDELLMTREGKTMSYEEFEEKFKALYFEVRRQQELRSAVCIYRDELWQKFVDRHGLSQSMMQSYFVQLQKEHKILVVIEYGKALVQWIE